MPDVVHSPRKEAPSTQCAGCREDSAERHPVALALVKFHVTSSLCLPILGTWWGGWKGGEEGRSSRSQALGPLREESRVCLCVCVSVCVVQPYTCAALGYPEN